MNGRPAAPHAASRHVLLRRVLWTGLLLIAGVTLTGCGSDSDPSVDAGATSDATRSDGSERYPDVIGAELSANGDGTYDVSATLSSPYDTAARYADAWRVLGPDGVVLGVRELTHDHATEQPFTRTLRGVTIPDGMAEVTIEGRDQLSGWGGATVTVDVPAS